jgi:hypothetical protein
MSHQSVGLGTHFRRRAKGRQFFLLAFIATMIASAATVTTHHHRPKPSTGKAEVLSICYGKTFWIGYTWDSLDFGRKLTFLSMSREEWMATAYETAVTTKCPEYRNR